VSRAETEGLATPAQVSEVVSAAARRFDWLEIGAHLHGRRADAVEKVLAAYDAGCRRFDSTLGGYGGCPFAQEDLVGNIPTELVLEALGRRNVELQLRQPLDAVLGMASEIASRFATRS